LFYLRAKMIISSPIQSRIVNPWWVLVTQWRT